MLKTYDWNWVDKFLFSAFGKFSYVHTLSECGLDCYLSNRHDVSKSHPDDAGCVDFLLYTGEIITTWDNKKKAGVRLYNMVDFKDPDKFIEEFARYSNLKAFL